MHASYPLLNPHQKLYLFSFPRTVFVSRLCNLQATRGIRCFCLATSQFLRSRPVHILSVKGNHYWQRQVENWSTYCSTPPASSTKNGHPVIMHQKCNVRVCQGAEYLNGWASADLVGLARKERGIRSGPHHRNHGRLLPFSWPLE